MKSQIVTIHKPGIINFFKRRAKVRMYFMEAHEIASFQQCQKDIYENRIPQAMNNAVAKKLRVSQREASTRQNASK